MLQSIGSDLKMASKRPKESAPKQNKVEPWWSALKIVALRALSKGEIPFGMLCLTLLLALFVVRVPKTDLVRIAELFLNSAWFSIFGWGGLIVSLIVIRYQTSVYRNEVRRLSDERNILQAKLIPEMKSSTQDPILIPQEIKHVS
jgi:hypothetical protein